MAKKKEVTVPRDSYIEAIEARRSKQLGDEEFVEAKSATTETESKEVKVKDGE